jgi:hypothetical protein
MIGKAYYLPPVKITTHEELKQMPDSVLTFEQKREKNGLLYIDSVSNIIQATHPLVHEEDLLKPDSLTKEKKVFYEYRPTMQVKQKENRFFAFRIKNYLVSERDHLDSQYNWEKPGKLTAGLQLANLYKEHPSVKWLGAGVGNFSSRIAFKATGLEIGGRYPEKYTYLHPYFQHGHLYVYLYYHAQWQINHTAANTPDSTYYQMAGEYGVVGICLFVFLYGGYFLWKTRRSGYALPVVFLMLAAFSVEYWFERVSIVILFEFLVLLDLRTLREGRTDE